MIKSKDGLIHIQIASNTGSFVFQPADWSVLNIPLDEKETESLFKNLYNSPVSNQAVLVLCRHRRKHRVEALRNIGLIKNFNYLETISLAYEKPSSCSNNGFLPLAEVGFLFYKGDIPDTKKTAWFSDGRHSNATNLWDIGPQDGESQGEYYQKFNWETSLILKSMMGTLSMRRFYYCLPVTAEEIKSIHSFCKEYAMVGTLIANSTEEARTLIKCVNEEIV